MLQAAVLISKIQTIAQHYMSTEGASLVAVLKKQWLQTIEVLAQQNTEKAPIQSASWPF